MIIKHNDKKFKLDTEFTLISQFRIKRTQIFAEQQKGITVQEHTIQK